MKTKLLVLLITLSLIFCSAVIASDLEVVEVDKPVATETAQPGAATISIPATATVSEPTIVRAQEDVTATPVKQEARKTMPVPSAITPSGVGEPTKYTLGPEDVIEISVRRHPEFSGSYPINAEGKIQYKFVGDIEIKGLTKTEVKDKIAQILGKFIISPDVDVTILEYKSKVIYVIGEVGAPGKYFMRADKVSLREAVVQAGLPTLSASMRKTQLIRPDKSGKPKEKRVDLYALLYEGKLNLDQDMLPGDVLVVPATLFAKIARIINPVTGPIYSGADAARRVQTGGF